MGKIVTIINQKGGAGKTTTTDALLSGLLKKGYKVLGIDLDPQINLTTTARADTDKGTILNILVDKEKAKNLIQTTPEHGDFIAGDRNLVGADAMITATGREFRLKEALEEVKKDYDYIFIDTPPALGILTINALTACDSVVIPAQASSYSEAGIMQLAETIDPVKKYTNPNIRIDGILLTRYNKRIVLSQAIREEIDKQIAPILHTKTYETTIREGVAIREAAYEQESIFNYALSAPAVQDYAVFLDEFLEREKFPMDFSKEKNGK